MNAPLDAKKGNEASDWKGGKPVRVVRNCKGRKHSEYAPEEGNRYDGIYKVCAMDKIYILTFFMATLVHRPTLANYLAAVVTSTKGKDSPRVPERGI